MLKTPIGLVNIVDITITDENKITRNDVLKAGFESKEQLLKSLLQNDKANIYKIQFSYHSEDPRIALREQKELTEDQFVVLKKS